MPNPDFFQTYRFYRVTWVTRVTASVHAGFHVTHAFFFWVTRVTKPGYTAKTGMF